MTRRESMIYTQRFYHPSVRGDVQAVVRAVETDGQIPGALAKALTWFARNDGPAQTGYAHRCLRTLDSRGHLVAVETDDGTVLHLRCGPESPPLAADGRLLAEGSR